MPKTEEAMNRFIEHLKSLNTVENQTKRQPLYRDSVGHWMLAECDQDSAHRTTMKILYSSYLLYCERMGIHPLNDSAFGKELSRLGFLVIRGAAGSSRWGLGLKNLLPETPSPPKKEPIIFIGTTLEMFDLLEKFDKENGEEEK
jgi:hypothetical protein